MSNRQVSLDEWISLLSVSTTFLLEESRQLAIDEISDQSPALPPVNRITLGTKHSVSRWVHTGCIDLCLRSEALTESEGKSLGLVTTVRILRAREEYRLNRGLSSVSAVIEKVFGFAPVEWGPKSLTKRRKLKGKK
jgi:hypothetical protein